MQILPIINKIIYAKKNLTKQTFNVIMCINYNDEVILWLVYLFIKEVTNGNIALK